MPLKNPLIILLLILSVTVIYGQTPKPPPKPKMLHVNTLIDLTNTACFSWHFVNFNRDQAWDSLVPANATVVKDVILSHGIDYGTHKIITMQLVITKLTDATTLDYAGYFKDDVSLKEESVMGDAKIVGNQLFFKSDKGNKKLNFIVKYKGDTIIGLQEVGNKHVYEKTDCSISDDEGTPVVAITEVEDIEDPTIKESPVCAYCDTITIRSNKPAIIAYYIKTLNKPNGGYYDQPKKNLHEPNKENGYGFTVYGNTSEEEIVFMIEFIELKKHFNPDEMNLYFLSKNTFVRFENAKREQKDFLNRTQLHKGFLYWNGKNSDNIVSYKEASMVSSKIVMQQSKKKFFPTYMTDFKIDSAFLSDHLGQFNPSDQVKEASQLLFGQLIDNDLSQILPFQFYNFKGVKTIEFEKAILRFDKNGNLTNVKAKEDVYEMICTYKDNLLTEIIEIDDHTKDTVKLSYYNNTILLKSEYGIKRKELVNKLLYTHLFYKVDALDYRIKFLRQDEINSTTIDGTFCVETKNLLNQEEKEMDCYTNTSNSLPLSIESKMSNADANGDMRSSTYIKDYERINGNELHFHNYAKDGNFSKRLIYIEKNGLPAQIVIPEHGTFNLVYTMYQP
jgi:hypothetical protein